MGRRKRICVFKRKYIRTYYFARNVKYLSIVLLIKMLLYAVLPAYNETKNFKVKKEGILPSF